MTHEMKLAESAFKAIFGGDKRVEMRLYDQKRTAIKVGDSIVFTNIVSGEQGMVKVRGLHVFPSFANLYVTYSPKVLGYAEGEKAHPDDMLKYYPREEQIKYGVVAIEIEV